MKKLLLAFLVTLSVRVLAVVPVPYTEPTAFSFLISGYGAATLTVQGEPGDAVTQSTANTWTESAVKTVWLRPGKTYSVTFQSTDIDTYSLSFIAPAGYAVYIDGVQADMHNESPGGGVVTDYYSLEIKSITGRAEAGVFSGINIGRSVSWDVGLGGLRDGRSAGRIHFREPDLAYAAYPATRDRLYYTPPASIGQITAVYDGPWGQNPRQIMVPQTLVDFVDDGGGGYWIKFYTPAQGTWTGSNYSISGSPWKTIRVESPGANQMKITETEGSVSKVSLLTLPSYVASQATGGTVTSSGGKTIHTFTSGGTFTVTNAGLTSVEALVVAGGGGGGAGLLGVMNAGGGGGGGVLYNASLGVSTTSYSVTVGAGGASGTNGGNSILSSMTAVGGGHGADAGWAASGATGGSGGGEGTAQGGSPGSGTSGQGNAGAAGASAPNYEGGGGGGAQFAGGSFYGGYGLSYSISGSSINYGAGGGGASNAASGGPGSGTGGGSTTPQGTDGTANTGGGGGGSAQWSSTGGSGGSGIVIISYSDSTSGAVATGNYTWRLQEGDASTCLRTTTHTSATYSGYREEIVEVRTGGSYGSTSGTVISKTKYRYENPGWGEEVTAVTTDPDNAALTTTYTYHTTSSELGNYRRVKTITQPDGNWASFDYHADWNQRGQLATKSGPWLDSPGTAQAAAYTVGRSSTHTYAPDFSGRYRLPYRDYYWVGGAATGQTVYSPWTNQTFNGQPFMSDSIDAYSDSSNYVRTQTEVIQGNGNPDYAGKPMLVRRPDGTEAARVFHYGSYNYSTKAFTSPGDYSHFREAVFHGTTAYVAGGYLNSYDGLGIPAIYVAPNQSTLDVIIRNPNGDVVRTETHICTSGTSFSLATWEDFTYDSQGRLTSRVASNGATTTNTYTNGLLTSTVDPTGTEIQFTYDAMSRVATSVKKGASASGSYAAQGDITTTYTYDGANRVAQTVASGSSLSLTASSVYDLSGRPTSSTAPGSYTTTFAYSSGGKVVTTTLPGSATKITEVHLDGQLKQVTGTGIVAEYLTHGIDGSGNRTLAYRQASSSTSAVTTTTSDWLGRKISFVQPGWSGSNTTQSWFYNSLGQLNKVTQPGLADTLYVYDSTTGKLTREGLDINANGTLDLSSNDRITDHVDEFYLNGSSHWYRKRQQYVYATASSSTATSLGVSYERITGFPSGRIAQTDSYDIYGNATTITTEVNASSKLVTTTRYVPDSTTTAITIAYNGLTVSSRDTANLTTTFGHDALGRPVTSTDPRTGTTTTAYISGTSQVYTVTDPASVVQATYAYDSAGRVSSVKDALNKYAYTSYTNRGEVYRQWGDTTYPVEYGYDNWGRRTTMSTYRGGSGWTGSTWPGSPGTADTTTWAYHEPTGLLSSKTDAASKAVTYTYTQARQIATREWARILTGTTHVTTSYTYSSTTGELTAVDYNDSTTDLAYTYNRLGNTATVTDYTGTRTFNYNLSGTLELQSEDLPSFFGTSRRITYPRATSGVIGRPNGLQLGSTSSPTADQSVTWGYDSYGRFNSVGAPGTFTYSYVSNSNLVGSVAMGAYTDVYTYDSTHNWLGRVQKTVSGGGAWSDFNYTRDNLGRATQIRKTEAFFARYGNGTEGLTTFYTYDDRSQVTGEVTKVGTGSTVLTGRDDIYAFDNIGNRSSSSGTTHNSNTANYTTNALNQYSQRTVPGVFDVAGAAGSSTTVTVNGSSSGVTRHGEYFFQGHSMSNNPSPVYGTLAVSDGTTTANLPAFTAGTPESFTYDDDGNLLSDGRWTYTYDAETRLGWMETSSAAITAGHPKLGFQFNYDYLGRRVRKVEYSWSGSSWITGTDRRLINDGWNLIAEFWGPYNSGNFPTANYRHIYWGLDRSGTLQGAGGVGGLLLITEAGAAYVPLYDANGNVHGLVNTSTNALSAAYEYDAFGNTLRETGTYAASNPFRFSTKYTDIETGLVYYGLRYYSPTLGRFINQDPLEEDGGLNLYGFCGNDGVNGLDYLGMVVVTLNGTNYNVVPIPTDIFSPSLTTALGGIAKSNPGDWGLSASVFIGSVSGFTLNGSSGYTYVGTPVPGGMSFTPITGYPTFDSSHFGGVAQSGVTQASYTYNGNLLEYRFANNTWYPARVLRPAQPSDSGTTTGTGNTEAPPPVNFFPPADPNMPTIGPADPTTMGPAPGIPITLTNVGAVILNAGAQSLAGLATFVPNGIYGRNSVDFRMYQTGAGIINDGIAEAAGIDPNNPRFGLATSLVQGAAPFAFGRFGGPSGQSMLSAAAQGRGNFGLGVASSETAMQLGRAWVGRGYRLASDGKTLISADGFRQFRPPSWKPRLGKKQANFEQRPAASGPWKSNGHLDVSP